jgi:hypothetical protein
MMALALLVIAVVLYACFRVSDHRKFMKLRERTALRELVREVNADKEERR